MGEDWESLFQWVLCALVVRLCKGRRLSALRFYVVMNLFVFKCLFVCAQDKSGPFLVVGNESPLR